MTNTSIRIILLCISQWLLFTPAYATEIRIGYQKSALNLTLLKERGLLEKKLAEKGDTVAWKEFAAGPQLLEALNVGSIDLGATGDTPPIFAQANGTQLLYVGNEPSRSQSSAILLPQASAIKTLKDLKGKRIAFQKGSSAHYFLIRALDSVGLSVEDIQPAYLPPADARAAFEQGAIDAWVIWDPYFAALEQTSHPKVLTSGKGFSSGFTFYLSSTAFAHQHLNEIETVFAALTENDTFIQKKQQEASGLLAKVTGLDPEVYDRVFKRRPSFKVGWLEPETIAEQQKIANRFFELKIINKPIVVEEIVLHR